jgi:hypothetical protein
MIIAVRRKKSAGCNGWILVPKAKGGNSAHGIATVLSPPPLNNPEIGKPLIRIRLEAGVLSFQDHSGVRGMVYSAIQFYREQRHDRQP